MKIIKMPSRSAVVLCYLILFHSVFSLHFLARNVHVIRCARPNKIIKIGFVTKRYNFCVRWCDGSVSLSLSLSRSLRRGLRNWLDCVKIYAIFVGRVD